MGTVVATHITVRAASPAYDAQFVAGYHRALQVGAAILLAGAAVAAVTIGRVRRPEPTAAVEASAAGAAPSGTPSFEEAG
jgi:hypothetical protein